MLSIAKMVSIQNRLLNGTDVKMEVLGGGDMSQCHIVHHRPHLDWPGIVPESPQ
jgi:hypothetical protein